MRQQLLISTLLEARVMLKIDGFGKESKALKRVLQGAEKGRNELKRERDVGDGEGLMAEGE
jgi:hypothetical protein